MSSSDSEKKQEQTQKENKLKNNSFKDQCKENQDTISNMKPVRTKIKYLKEYMSTLIILNMQYHQKNPQVTLQQSQIIEKQQQLFDQCSIFQSEQNTQHLLQKLMKANIKISKQNIVDFEILSIRQSLNCEVVQLKVQINRFELNINVLNVAEQNIIQNQLEVYKFGGFGKIYLCQHDETYYAIKKIQYNKENFENIKIVTDDKDCFFQILKEFCFAKIFSALEIGPKLKNICGFDLIMNYEFIYFSMQICQSESSFEQQDLKILLKTMHSLKIIHRDIKFSNIMFSPSYNKNVFIDFGGCIFIQEFLGFQTKTQFYGTLKYCSQQMKQLNKNEDFIDLYYNDLYALKIVFQKVNKIGKSQSTKVQHQYQANMLQKIARASLDVIYCKFLIWTSNFNILYRFINQKHLKNNDLLQKQILEFMMELTPSFELIKFYQDQISNETKQISKFLSLSSYFSSNFSGTYQYPSNTKRQYQYFSQFYLKLSQKFESKQVHGKKTLCLSTYRQKISHEIYENILTKKNFQVIWNQIKKKQNFPSLKQNQYLQFTLCFLSFIKFYFIKANLKNIFQISQIILQIFNICHVPGYKGKQISIYLSALIMEYQLFKNMQKLKSFYNIMTKQSIFNLFQFDTLPFKIIFSFFIWKYCHYQQNNECTRFFRSTLIFMKVQNFSSFYNMFEKLIFQMQNSSIFQNKSLKYYRASILNVFKNLYIKFSQIIKDVEQKIEQSYYKTQNKNVQSQWTISHQNICLKFQLSFLQQKKH